MSALFDSKAVSKPTVLVQHHTAITLLGQLLGAPGIDHITWLDLACGKGQILTQLDKNIPDEDLRKKISYFGYDIENKNSRLAEKIAGSLKLRDVDVKVGELAHFAKLFPVVPLHQTHGQLGFSKSYSSNLGLLLSCSRVKKVAGTCGL